MDGWWWVVWLAVGVCGASLVWWVIGTVGGGWGGKWLGVGVCVVGGMREVVTRMVRLLLAGGRWAVVD